MKEASFDISARREALGFYKEPDLHQTVETSVDTTLSTKLPSADTPEAAALDAQLKPLRYALLGKVIEGIVRTELSPEDHEVITRHESEIYLMRGEIKQVDFRRLEYRLGVTFEQKLEKYFHEADNAVILQDLESMSSIHRRLDSETWRDLEFSLRGGLSTMTVTSRHILEAFNKRLEGLGINDKYSILQKSYSSLIEIAQFNSLQLMAVVDSLDEGRHPDIVFVPPIESLGFRHSFLELGVSDEVRELRLSKWLPLGHKEIKTIRDIDNGDMVIGCPVLFKAGQVRELWDLTIDEAKKLDLI